MIGSRLIPILIIGHARPELMASTIDSVIRAGCIELYFSIDGPRPTVATDLAKVNECRVLVKKLADSAELKVRYIFHNVNLGSAANVIGSLDWVFTNEQKVIVLEDDCVPVPTFFDYMNLALEFIENDENLWIASGYRPNISGISDNEGYVTHAPMTWGWATTKNKWREMKTSIFMDSSRDSIFKTSILNNDLIYWKIGALRAIMGWVDFWDVPLAHSMKFRNRLSLIPSVNLIVNKGTGTDATNTKQQSIYLNSAGGIWSNKKLIISKVNLGQKEIMRRDLLINKQMHQIKLRHKISPIIKFGAQFLGRIMFGRQCITLERRVMSFMADIESNQS